MDFPRLLAGDQETEHPMTRGAGLVRLALVVLAVAALSPPGLARAQQGEWQEQVRVVSVVPDDHCDPIRNLGTVFTLDTTAGVGFELGYGLTRVLEADVSLAVSRHTLHTSGGLDGGLDAGAAWLAPITLTLQYRPLPAGTWHPYVGLGLAYGQLFAYDISADMQAHSVGDLQFKGSVGLAARAGVLYDTSERWFASFDVTYLHLEDEITVITRGGLTYAVVDMNLDPWQFGLGMGYRF